jgi:hypothetical protein
MNTNSTGPTPTPKEVPPTNEESSVSAPDSLSPAKEYHSCNEALTFTTVLFALWFTYAYVNEPVTLQELFIVNVPDGGLTRGAKVLDEQLLEVVLPLAATLSVQEKPPNAYSHWPAIIDCVQGNTRAIWACAGLTNARSDALAQRRPRTSAGTSSTRSRSSTISSPGRRLLWRCRSLMPITSSSR